MSIRISEEPLTTPRKMSETVYQKLDSMTGIFRESRKRYVDISQPLVWPMPELKKQLKIKSIPADWKLGPRTGPKRVRAALSVFLQAFLTERSIRFSRLGWNLNRFIEFVDFDALALQTGVKFTIEQTPNSPQTDWSSVTNPNAYYQVQHKIVNASLPFAKAMAAMEEEKKRRTQILSERAQAVEVIIEKLRMQVVEVLPTLYEAGVDKITLPSVNWDNPRETDASRSVQVYVPRHTE